MAKGLSLHIGLNEVDPRGYRQVWHWASAYSVFSYTGEDEGPLDLDLFEQHAIPEEREFTIGWSGPLVSCENDARCMYEIAQSRGFDAELLLTSQATSAAVVDRLETAAAALVGGDFFLLTYAGHGGQVDDLTGDERDEVDETWCLYDRMLIDDEIWHSLSKFAAGVRVLVIADCCHSGTTVRSANEDADRGTRPGAAPETGPRVREMPRETTLACYLGRRREYDRIQEAIGLARNELKATLIQISACQDKEKAGDGDHNGRFTEALLKIWGDGSFAGDYAAFHAAIAGELESTYDAALRAAGNDENQVRLTRQQPNLLTEPALGRNGPGPQLAAFLNQSPIFSI